MHDMTAFETLKHNSWNQCATMWKSSQQKGVRSNSNPNRRSQIGHSHKRILASGPECFFRCMHHKRQRNSPVKNVLRSHELRKKRNYNQRIIQVEHGTLTPLIFSTSGAMGNECQKFHKTLADKISTKNGDKYDDVMRYIRVKISFLVLKATLLCVRGSRTIKRNIEAGDDFGLCLNELRV